ncbi:Fur-regulated basic protein FbpA [Kurthia zopfii]|nr:Fur-regulated basic protein FbpA [Kurthia zopfii]VEI05879.1 Uncharacterised protein [Kurthia zopfii]
MKKQQSAKDAIIEKLMKIGVYKIQNLQLYEVPFIDLMKEYKKYVNE